MERVDHDDALLWSEVGAADEDSGVADTTNLDGICYQTHRCGINKDIVVVLAQLGKDVVKALTRYEL